MSKCLVFLPVYNGDKYLRETVESVLSQSWQDLSLIIYDDCSTDNSVEIIEEYLKKYPGKIKFYKNQKNLGVGNTLYNCYKNNHDGDYVAMIGHDDIWEKNYLEKQIEALAQTNARAAFSHVVYINENGKRISGSIFKHDLIDKLDGHSLFLRLIIENFLCAPSSVMKITGIEDEVTEFWGYNNDRLQDYELWLNMCFKGAFIYNRTATCCYRWHGQNFSDKTKRVIQGKLEYYSTLQRVLFSSRFVPFLEKADDVKSFIDSLIDNLQLNIPYSNPLKLLLISLCEHLLNKHYISDKLTDTLLWLYMDSGLTTKCLTGGRKLPDPISLVECGIINNKAYINLKKMSENFIFDTGMEKITARTFAIAEYNNLESFEYLLNNNAFFDGLWENQVAVICSKDNMESIKRTYPNILVLDEDLNENQMERQLLSFIEDHTHIYRNGLFDMISFCNTPETALRKIQIQTDEESVRKIKFLDYQPLNAAFYKSDGTAVLTMETDKDCIFLENNHLDDGVLLIECEADIEINVRIIVNNKLYVCQDVHVDDNGGKTMFFGKLCYFNNPILQPTE